MLIATPAVTVCLLSSNSSPSNAMLVNTRFVGLSPARRSSKRERRFHHRRHRRLRRLRAPAQRGAHQHVVGMPVVSLTSRPRRRLSTCGTQSLRYTINNSIRIMGQEVIHTGPAGPRKGPQVAGQNRAVAMFSVTGGRRVGERRRAHAVAAAVVVLAWGAARMMSPWCSEGGWVFH